MYVFGQIIGIVLFLGLLLGVPVWSGVRSYLKRRKPELPANLTHPYGDPHKRR